MSDTSTRQAIEADSPLQDFSTCHIGFVTLLETSLGLPEMVTTSARARSCAADMVKMFRHSVLAHHEDEERDLFPAVLQVAQAGAEADRAQAMVAQLVREHRDIAALWKELEPDRASHRERLPAWAGLRAAARVERYNEHVRIEEVEFLPFAQQVLARQGEDMAMLGLALHRRHEAAEIMATAVIYGAT